MRAVVYDGYGPPDVLRVENLPKPSPAARQVLVKVAATSVNLSDWEALRGWPLYSRIPAALTFAQASAIPQAGVIARQGTDGAAPANGS
jgi:threonine dehydrogenase-like Zn-dependent dehydrogenase